MRAGRQLMTDGASSLDAQFRTQTKDEVAGRRRAQHWPFTGHARNRRGIPPPRLQRVHVAGMVSARA